MPPDPTFVIDVTSARNLPELHETVEQRADRLRQATRIRSHDEMVPAEETKKRLRACRKTFRIGDTIFRCDVKDSPAGHKSLHEEHGVITGESRTVDTEYHVTWQDVPKKVIRVQPK